jgi:hypothetical protein
LAPVGERIGQKRLIELYAATKNLSRKKRMKAQKLAPEHGIRHSMGDWFGTMVYSVFE